MPREIEIKFRIADLNSLTRALPRAGFQQITPPTHEMNALYDLPGQKLRKKGELLRLRKYGDVWTLTHKSKGKAGRSQSAHRIGDTGRERPANGCDPARSWIQPNVSL